jgi:hypothetical protein
VTANTAERPPLELNIDDDAGFAIEILRGGAHIATVNNFYDFPCLTDEEEDLPRVHAEAVETSYRFAASDDLVAACVMAVTVLRKPADDADIARRSVYERQAEADGLSTFQYVMRALCAALVRAGVCLSCFGFIDGREVATRAYAGTGHLCTGCFGRVEKRQCEVEEMGI